jgi:DNA mismatch endonuclease (patch repair protein)
MVTKAPSFAGLRPSSAVSSHAKRSNPNRDTLHEVALRRELRRMGLRFRKNVKSLPGRPDIVFSAERVAIFCDGDFWHGRNWRLLSRKLRQGWNAAYWLAKIRSNMERDRRNTALLRELGWRVIRLWEGKIARDPAALAKRVVKRIRARRHPRANRTRPKGRSA